MLQYTNYKGFGINYSSIGGTTSVNYCGFLLEEFENMGQAKGKDLAMNFVDELCDASQQLANETGQDINEVKRNICKLIFKH